MKALGVVLLALLLPSAGTTVEDGPRQGVGSLDATDAAGADHPLELRSLAVEATVRGDAALKRVALLAVWRGRAIALGSRERRLAKR